jgi:Flp pilus assembly protein TadG
MTSHRGLLHARSAGRRERGQGLVEFAIILPVFLLLLVIMLDMGFAFYSNLTIAYASREGARVGAALANGGGAPGCGAGQSPNAGTVDTFVIAAVERVLTSAGIRLDVNPSGGGGVTAIRIFKANPTTGADTGVANVWTYSAGSGPTIPGTTHALDFTETSHGWNACARVNSIAASDTLGVSIAYRYAFITPVVGVFRLVTPGGVAPTISMGDRTVMRLNPTGQ